MDNASDDPRQTTAEAADTMTGAADDTAQTALPHAYEAPSLPPLPPPRVAAPPPRTATAKAPLLALFLSVFPGLGQLYNEQPAKAVTFFFLLVGSIYGTAEISPFPFAFLIPFVWFYNLIDAWTSANDINQRGALPRKDKSLESPAWGATLLGLGLVLLLNNLGWLQLASLGRYWPLALVVIGALFLLRALRARQGGGERFDERPL